MHATLTSKGTKKKDAEHFQAWKSVMVESIIFSLDENAVNSCGVVRGGNRCFNLALGTRGHPGNFGIQKNLSASFLW
jgi:hypothetical protein